MKMTKFEATARNVEHTKMDSMWPAITFARLSHARLNTATLFVRFAYYNHTGIFVFRHKRGLCLST